MKELILNNPSLIFIAFAVALTLIFLIALKVNDLKVGVVEVVSTYCLVSAMLFTLTVLDSSASSDKKFLVDGTYVSTKTIDSVFPMVDVKDTKSCNSSGICKIESKTVLHKKYWEYKKSFIIF